MLTEHGHDLSGPTTERPTNAEIGQRFFDTTLGVSLVYNGTVWIPESGILAQSFLFTENGAGTYTATFAIPAGAVIVDIIVNAIALWAAGTSASLEIGATDPDGYYTAVDLKATDLLAGESLRLAAAGGVQGAYVANSHVTPAYFAAATNLVATVVSVGAGTTGRTLVTVLYALSTPQAAVKA